MSSKKEMNLNPMSKDEWVAAHDLAPFIPVKNRERVRRLIKADTVLTGSRAFDVSGEDSDWDYVITVAFMDEFIQPLCTRKWRELAVGFENKPWKPQTVYIRYGNELVNLLIVTRPEHVLQWYRATLMMQGISAYPWGREKLKDKGVRVRLFELFLDMLRGSDES